MLRSRPKYFRVTAVSKLLIKIINPKGNIMCHIACPIKNNLLQNTSDIIQDSSPIAEYFNELMSIFKICFIFEI